MQHPTPYSNPIQSIEFLEQPSQKILLEVKQHATSPAEFRTLAEKSFTLWSFHRHTD